MTELMVGTKKGLFVLEGDPAGGFEVSARAFAGEPVEFALRDPGSGRILAGVTSAFYGPKLHYAEQANGEWEQATGVQLPEGGEHALQHEQALLGSHQQLGHRAPPEIAGRTSTRSPSPTGVSGPPRSPRT